MITQLELTDKFNWNVKSKQCVLDTDSKSTEREILPNVFQVIDFHLCVLVLCCTLEITIWDLSYSFQKNSVISSFLAHFVFWRIKKARYSDHCNVCIVIVSVVCCLRVRTLRSSSLLALWSCSDFSHQELYSMIIFFFAHHYNIVWDWMWPQS